MYNSGVSFPQISFYSSASWQQFSEAAAPVRPTLDLTANSDTHQSRRYNLNSGSFTAPVVTERKKIHKSKRRDTHVNAIHNLADVLELNPALAAAAAAMRLPTRTKVTSFPFVGFCLGCIVC